MGQRFPLILLGFVALASLVAKYLVYQWFYIRVVREHVRIQPSSPRYRGVVPGAIGLERLTKGVTGILMVAVLLTWCRSGFSLLLTEAFYLPFRTWIWFTTLSRHRGVADVSRGVLVQQALEGTLLSLALDLPILACAWLIEPAFRDQGVL